MLALVVAAALQGASPTPAPQAEVIIHPVFVGAIIPPDNAPQGTQVIVPSGRGDHEDDVVCKVVVPADTRFKQKVCERRYRWNILTSESRAYLLKAQQQSMDGNPIP